MKKIIINLILFVPFIVNAQSYDVNGDYKITGKVGIGTNSPEAKLSIIGNATALELDTEPSGSFILSYNRSSSTFKPLFLRGSDFNFMINDQGKFFINNTGNVGIGTSTPGGKLVVSENGTAITIGSGSIGFNRNYVDGYIYNNNSTAWQINGNNDGFGISGFNGAINQPFKILNDGKIGIGTPTPDEDLTVKGVTKIYPNKTGDARSFLVRSTFLNHSFIDNNYPVVLATGGGNQPLILDAARVGIGTNDPKNKLSVNGTVWATEVKVSLTDGVDWVFEDDYDLRTLEEVEEFIKQNKHLPEIPSAEEFRKNDLNVAEMDNKLLQKIEELTLYMIDMNKRMGQLENENKELKAKVRHLENQ
ncbi:MAG: hypothetical protein O9262_15115 [Cyclobacteriaceae bacterium]|nr:hypothetical protein [Cyclobacteriaceae bacterium]